MANEKQFSDVFYYFNQKDIVEKNRQIVTDGAIGSSGTITSFEYLATQYADSSSHYFMDVYDSANTASGVQFDISYGNRNGYSGSYDDTYSPSEVTYNQYANKLLNVNTYDTSSNIFKWANLSESVDMFIVNFKRDKLKEKLDAGNWELKLTNGSSTISLIDSSTDTNLAIGNGFTGPKYNIVSGTFINSTRTYYTTEDADSSYGTVYPDLGIILLNPQQLQAGFGSWTYSGSAVPFTNNVINEFFKVIDSGSYFAARNEEVISSLNYFVRAGNENFNFSNNPTWQTGSNGVMRYTEMNEDPITYVTTIGLYNDDNELLAIAKLSKPVEKSFENELLVKVRLDF